MKKFLVFLLILSGGLTYGQSKNVLFIGNSFIIRNDLPQIISNMASSLGDNLNFGNVSVANSSLSFHSTDPNCLNAIHLGYWDYVVLQEYSTFPSNPIDWVQQNVYPYAQYLNNEIHAYNTQAQTMFYMTWGRENGDPDRCPYYPDVCTYVGMDDLTRQRYMAMTLNNNAQVSPVGAVWRYIRDNYPGIELYDTDGNHPSEAGSYAAACCFYTAIFRKDPTLITYNYTINSTQADQIKSAVKTIVFNSLSTWYLSDTKSPAVTTGLVSSSITETSFTLNWSASTDDVGVTGYDVFKDGILISTVSGTSANISGLTKATSYVMTVKAKDAAGNSSASSSPCNVTTSDFTGKTILIITGLTANFKVYDGTITTTLNTASATLVGVVSPDDVNLVTSGATGSFIDRNVGTGKTVIAAGFSLSGADASKYVLIQPTLSAYISPKPVLVIATAGLNKVYGDNDPVFTYSFSPALLGSDTFTGSLGREMGEDANNNYAITRGTLYAGFNYTISFASNNFGISAKPVTVTVTPGQSKVYGQTDPVFTYSYSPGLIGTDTFTGSLTRTAGENAGSYQISKGTLYAGTNYVITFTPNNFIITPKAILITAASGQTKTYGQADPVFTYTYSPSLESGGSFSGDLSRNAGTNIGQYQFTLGTLTAGSNYSLSISSSPNFSITAKPLLVTGIFANNKVYDGNTSATLGGIALLVGVVSGDEVTLGGAPVATFSSPAIADGIAVSVTGYTISGSAAGNYILTQPTGLTANITLISGISENRQNSLSCSVYPNPTSEFIILNVANFNEENLSYILIDNRGILFENKKIVSNETIISMQIFLPGTYFVKIFLNANCIKTIKIIKR